MCQWLWGVPNIETLAVKPGRKWSTLSALPLTSHQTCDIIRHINGRLGSAFLKHFSDGANFAIFSTDLRALLLCLLHCNLTQVGLETCWFWSAKKHLPRHPTFNVKWSMKPLETLPLHTSLLWQEPTTRQLLVFLGVIHLNFVMLLPSLFWCGDIIDMRIVIS